MNTRTHGLLTLILGLSSATCGPAHPPAEDAGEDPRDRLADACADLCQRFVECPGEFVSSWQVSDLGECEGYCVHFGDFAVDELNDPECIDLHADLWECGAKFQTCEEFEYFQSAASGLGGLEDMDCWPELMAVSPRCT